MELLRPASAREDNVLNREDGLSPSSTNRVVLMALVECGRSGSSPSFSAGEGILDRYGRPTLRAGL